MHSNIPERDTVVVIPKLISSLGLRHKICEAKKEVSEKVDRHFVKCFDSSARFVLERFVPLQVDDHHCRGHALGGKLDPKCLPESKHDKDEDQTSQVEHHG